MDYDIVGDIHGHAVKLEELLLKLNYKMIDGVYQNSERKAVFVGDFIDRGTQNRRVIEIVRPMVNGKHAYAVMGNHEYNAICYHTRKLGTDDWLRPHTKSKFKQHENFLTEYPVGHEDTNEVIAWFKTLPLFKEFKHFRVIHACWDKRCVKLSKQYLNKDNTLKEEFIAESAINNSNPKSLFNILERLLKGVEVRLPEPPYFKDKDGKDRYDIRIKWWGEIKTGSYKKIAFGYGDKGNNFSPKIVAPGLELPSYKKKQLPVFFGHYWMAGTPYLQQKNVCCVDYSAGKGQKLVCYCWNKTEGSRLNKKNFRWSGELK